MYPTFYLDARKGLNKLHFEIDNLQKGLIKVTKQAFRDAMDDLLSDAKFNVSGGIIGGRSRLDGKTGDLADALKMKIKSTAGKINGQIYIDRSSPMWIAGAVQESGAGPIQASEGGWLWLAKEPESIPSGSKSLRGVFTKRTSGVPASHWLTRTFNEGKNNFQDTVSSRVEEFIASKSKG